MLKVESGDVRIKEGASFAFVNDTFIDPNSVKRYNLSNGDQIKVRSMMAYNKTKQNWGWKMIDKVS